MLRLSPLLLASLVLASCADEGVDSASPFDWDTGEAPASAEAKVTVLSTCFGDNDYSTTSGCFRTDSRSGTWTYDSSTTSGYYYNDARYTTSTSARAYWEFDKSATATYGDVWFSAWIPARNATAVMSYYFYCWGDFETWTGYLGSIDQAAYSGQWVTLGRAGYLNTNVRCTITGMKTGGTASSRAAMDGMKMTVYW